MYDITIDFWSQSAHIFDVSEHSTSKAKALLEFLQHGGFDELTKVPHTITFRNIKYTLLSDLCYLPTGSLDWNSTRKNSWQEKASH